MGTMKPSSIVLLMAISTISVAGTLSHKQTAVDRVVVTLENAKPLEIQQAQGAILPYAVELCDGKFPAFGKYKYKSTESVKGTDSDSKDQNPPSFLFVQEIECVKENPKAQKLKRFDISKEQEDLIKMKATDLTIEYLFLKESGQFDGAYKKLGSSMQDITGYAAWEQRESNYFNGNLGKLVTREIWNATIYNNPSNSPKPGIYVAIDYENEYELAPIHCGYVIWFMPEVDLNHLSIIREEYGSIPKNVVQNNSPEDLRKLREKMRCRVL